MATLAVWSPHGALLGAAAPLALAAARSTALVIDLDRAGPTYPGDTTLRRLVEEGPRRSDLEPGRKGLAVLANGGVSLDAARVVVDELTRRWPDVVFRLPAGADDAAAVSAALPGTGVVPVIPLLPGELFRHPTGPAVYQPAGWSVPCPQPGYQLPALRARTIGALLSGTRPVADRWINAWAKVWRLRWV